MFDSQPFLVLARVSDIKSGLASISTSGPYLEQFLSGHFHTLRLCRHFIPLAVSETMCTNLGKGMGTCTISSLCKGQVGIDFGMRPCEVVIAPVPFSLDRRGKGIVLHGRGWPA